MLWVSWGLMHKTRHEVIQLLCIEWLTEGDWLSRLMLDGQAPNAINSTCGCPSNRSSTSGSVISLSCVVVVSCHYCAILFRLCLCVVCGCACMWVWLHFLLAADQSGASLNWSMLYSWSWYVCVCERERVSLLLVCVWCLCAEVSLLSLRVLDTRVILSWWHVRICCYLHLNTL